MKPRPKVKRHFFDISFTKIVYRYLVKKFVSPFFLTFFLALLIIDMQFLWKYVDDLVGKGLEWYLILELLFYVSATFVTLAMALAVLLSSLMTFGNLGEKYEIVALKSAGISITSLMKPLALISLLLAVFSFWFSDNVVPAAYVKWRTMMYEIAEQKPTLSMDEGVFYDGIDGYIIRIGKKHRDNENIEDVLIYDHSKHMGNITGTYAKRGTMTITPDKKFFVFTLYDGYLWDESRNQNSRGAHYPYFFARFSKQYMKMDISSFEMQNVSDEFFKENSKASKLQKIGEEIVIKKSEMNVISEDVFRKYEAAFYKDLKVRGEGWRDRPVTSQTFQFEELSPAMQEHVYYRALAKADNLLGSLSQSHLITELKERELREFQIEYHQRLVLPLACFLFFFIGAPLGTIIRKGGIGIPLVITVVFFAFYFVISIFGEKMAKNGDTPVWFGMWLSTFVTVPIWVFLTYKAAVDSAVMSPDAYANFFRKAKTLLHKKSRKTQS